MRTVYEVVERLKIMGTPPTEAESFKEWVVAGDVLPLLESNTRSTYCILYASLPNVFLHAVAIPQREYSGADVEDLLNWNFNPYSSWSTSYSFQHQEETIESPPSGSGSAIIDSGEQLVFARSFSGRLGRKQYVEATQKLTHLSDLHWIEQRNAYCRHDCNGDLEEVLKVTEIEDVSGLGGGTVVTIHRDKLSSYLKQTKATLAVMFDFTRLRIDEFGGWRESHLVQSVKSRSIYGRRHVEVDRASFTRGIDITGLENEGESDSPPLVSEYATFIAHDWKNEQVKEISCSPQATANYFTDSELPFELSPAFFRPEVLVRYKADSEKYDLQSRTISCRDAWHLQSYDINEAGQVHTYLVYLRNLPFSEQLYWKSYNEQPKGSISKRAYLADFEGSWDLPHDPLDELKNEIRSLVDQKVKWFKQRAEDGIDRLHYPVTDSADEWANEIVNLDQLVVEGLEKAWFKCEIENKGDKLDPSYASILALRECLQASGVEKEVAIAVVAPFQALHSLRTKLRGHAASQSTRFGIRNEVTRQHGSLQSHFKSLVEEIRTSLIRIRTAFP